MMSAMRRDEVSIAVIVVTTRETIAPPCDASSTAEAADCISSMTSSIAPISEVIAAAGYESAFFWFGLGQGVIVFMLAWLLRSPTRRPSLQGVNL
mgnify:CR=1 FL=1